MKIEEQVLSREQMAHLKELGVDTSDASMAWFMSPKTNQWKIKVKNNFSHELLLRLSPERYIPAYTIGDIIEKLPKDLSSFSLALQYEHDKIGYYETSYGNIDTHHEEDLSNNPILGLYNMLCWVAEKHKELIK